VSKESPQNQEITGSTTTPDHGKLGRREFLQLGIKSAVTAVVTTSVIGQALADEKLPEIIRTKEDFIKVARAEYERFKLRAQESWKREEPRWEAAKQKWQQARNLHGQDLIQAELEYQTARRDYYKMKEQECDYRYMNLDIKYLGRPTYLGKEGSKEFYDQDEKLLKSNANYQKEYRTLYEEESSYVDKMYTAEARIYELTSALANQQVDRLVDVFRR